MLRAAGERPKNEDVESSLKQIQLTRRHVRILPSTFE
jgi:hypothetical protein